MRLKCRAIGVLLCTSMTIVGAHGQTQQYPFQNSALPLEQRVDNLLGLLTTEEKISLLGRSINVPRLGIHAQGAVPTIPGSGGQFEGLHGVTLGGPANWGRRSPGGPGEHGGESTIATTQFPQAVGLGETWDPELVQQAAAVEGQETRFVFQSYDRGGLIVRAPNADLARDPRWGRTEESYGEDPYLTGTMATAYVRGLQGNDPKYLLTISMLKHFMANSNEDNRSGSSSNFDARLLHEYYAAPFRMAIEHARANAIMASYNAVNGTPMTANPLLTDLLIKQWGFDGLIDTDRGALTYMVVRHKFYPDMEHSVAGAIHAGVNQFLNPYEAALHGALEKKLVTEAEIDRNLRGLIRVLIRAGLMDPAADVPYSKMRGSQQPAPWDSAEVKDLALRLTRESVVLLKNDAASGGGRLLPLDARTKSIAVVGPRADKVYADFYGGTPPFAISPLEGIQQQAGKGTTIRYSATGEQAVALARSADVAIVILGNDPTCGEKFGVCSDPTEGKEAVDRKQITLNPEQEALLEQVYAANPRTVLVLVTGFPYAITWAQQHVPAIVHMSHSSEVEGRALAEVLFGSYNPGGRLVATWPASLDQLPPMMDYDLRHGRTYMFAKNRPLYPFGYGLSYTNFHYSNLRLSEKTLRNDGRISVSVEVENTGRRQGDEVVQLYVRHTDSNVPRPLEELKGFRRITLKTGEKKTVPFELRAKDLAYWNEENSAWVVEPDHVELLIGSSSSDTRLRAALQVAAR